MPQTIKIPKKEYQRLTTIADRFELLRQFLSTDFFAEPPVKNAKQVVKEFEATGLYNDDFLKSLAKGLSESTYFSRSR